ncbi:unnamed protein product, partial [Phaeothamnion confervicola]
LEVYDAIVCDPPYGLRAGARKSGAAKPNAHPIRNRETFIPQTQTYPVGDVLVDLLDVAGRSLVVRGRLCYLLPSTWDFDIETDLPRHPCLRLIHHSVQGLSQKICRRMITMEKTQAYDAA